MAKCTICGEVGHPRRQDFNCARKKRMKSNPPNPEVESEGKTEQLILYNTQQGFGPDVDRHNS